MSNGLKIITSQLTKRFGNFTAVDNLDLTVESGESYGFLGPNGAGKTTTILMILGIHQPTSGKVLINGKNVSSAAFDIKNRIGVVAEYQVFYEDMTAWEYLMFFARLYCVENPEKKGQNLLEQLSLWEWRDVLVGGYSTGMKKKLSFAKALVHSPDLLILDEPVSGLDPFGIIQQEKAQGCSVLISSHILSEVEKTVDRVGIIANGKLIRQDSMDKIRKNVSGFERYNLSFTNIDDRVLGSLAKLEFVIHLEKSGNNIILDTKDDADYSKKIGTFILEHQLIVTEMKKPEKTLEEAFITITENNLDRLAGRKID